MIFGIDKPSPIAAWQGHHRFRRQILSGSADHIGESNQRFALNQSPCGFRLPRTAAQVLQAGLPIPRPVAQICPAWARHLVDLSQILPSA
jgi:hypothetical protein